MGMLSELEAELRALNKDLEDPSLPAEVAARLRARVAEMHRVLASQNAMWVGTTEAKRLLGVKTENTVKAWARAGLLRSRTLPNGRVQVHLDDVHRRATDTTALTTPWDEPASDEDLQSLSRARPGTTPWQRKDPQAPQ
jgi:hypothetical protein